MRVQAIQEGFYNGQTRNIGDVFDLNSPADYSDSTIDYLAGFEGSPLFGWMLTVSSAAPLQSNAPQPLVTPAFNGTIFYATLPLTNKPRTVL